MTTETLQELTDEWKAALKEARERVLWFSWPQREEYFQPDHLEKLLKHGLKLLPCETVLIDAMEVIRRKYQQIDNIRNEIAYIKRQCGY